MPIHGTMLTPGEGSCRTMPKVQEEAQRKGKGKESSAGSPEQRCVSNTPASGELNVANLQEAEVEIIKQVQRQAFPSEIRSLQIV